MAFSINLTPSRRLRTALRNLFAQACVSAIAAVVDDILARLQPQEATPPERSEDARKTDES